MDNEAMFKQACSVVKEAIDADNSKEYRKAFNLYQKSLTYFAHVIKFERNPQTKATIEMKALEYMERAEELKKMLDSAGGAAGASGGGTAAMTGEADDKDTEKKKLQGALSGAILSEKPNVKWSDVAGLEGAKEALQEAVIMPVQFPQFFTGKRRPWKGILMYGPPGTGKSYLAKAVATEANSTFFSVSSSDLVSKWQGESERLVKQLFEMARDRRPAIIFVDEIDSLCSTRGEGENEASRRIKTEFLVQMQGVGHTHDGILVLGATNTPWEIDSAMRRRFEKRVYIPLPESHARAAIFKIHLGDTPHNLTDADFSTLGSLTEGFSGSDISVMVRQALMEPLRKCRVAKYFKREAHPPPGASRPSERVDLFQLKSDELRVPDITMDDFLHVAKASKSSVAATELTRFVDWTKEFGEEGQ